MRKLKTIYVIAVATFMSCNSSQEDLSHEIYILVDNTEISQERENLIATQKIGQMIEESRQVKVTFEQLNAVSINSNKSIELSMPEDPTALQVKKLREPFFKEFEDTRKIFLGPVTKGTDNSSLYKPICQALIKMQKSKASMKKLIIVSDMVENSDFGNFYKADDFKSVKSKLGESGVKIPQNVDVDVIIIFDPKGNTKIEKNHNKAMKIWDGLFKDAGIKYSVQANL